MIGYIEERTCSKRIDIELTSNIASSLVSSATAALVVVPALRKDMQTKEPSAVLLVLCDPGGADEILLATNTTEADALLESSSVLFIVLVVLKR